MKHGFGNIARGTIRRAALGTATVVTAGALIAGCSAGTSSLQQPSLQQPGASPSPGSADTKSASELEKIDAAALKASRLAVFVTATPPKGVSAYTHVWAPILRIQLVDEKASMQTIWDGGTEGLSVDLTALAGNGTGGSQKFMGIVGAPVNGDKAIERVLVTFGKAFDLYNDGSTVAKETVFADGVTRDTEGHPTVSFALAKPRDLGTGKENLVINFDLGALAVKDDKVTPTLNEGDATALADLTRQVQTTFTGTVSGVMGSAPTSKFVLGADVTTSPMMIVQTSASTSLFNDDASTNPALIEKERVRIRGVLSPETKRIVASEITAFPASKTGTAASTGSPSALTGSFSDLKPDDRTLVIKADQVEGLTPTQQAVTVTLSADAMFRSASGLPLKADEFWDTLKSKGAPPLLRVDGVFDGSTATFTASRAKIESPTIATTHEADAEGTAKFVDIGDKSFTLATPLVKWDGIASPDDKSKGIQVTITPATQFKDETGGPLAEAHFFEVAIKDKEKPELRVQGIYNAKGVFTATKIEFKPRPVAAASPSPTPAAGATPSPTPAAGAAAATASATPAAGAPGAAATTTATPAPTGIATPAPTGH